MVTMVAPVKGAMAKEGPDKGFDMHTGFLGSRRCEQAACEDQWSSMATK